MAISQFKSATMRCTFDNGLDNNGKPKKKAKTYQNVTETASADAIHAVAIVLEGFGTQPLLILEKHAGQEIFA